MKATRSLFPSIILGLALLSFLILYIPIPGYAASPHPCTPTISAHQGNLPGVANFTFTFARDCPPDTSNATKWNFNIYNYYAQSTPICSLPTYTPPNPQGYLNIVSPYTVTLPCSGLPYGTGKKVKIAISYIVPGPSTMSHADVRNNP